ncbi:MAG: hypothetical protein KDC49_12990 [Saprospiraceae bacterium]|nr:hypothetical protein [Saprospiraceae bacterium]
MKQSEFENKLRAMIDSSANKGITDYHWKNIQKSLHPKRKRRPFVIIFFIGMVVFLIAYVAQKHKDADLLKTKSEESSPFASTFPKMEPPTEPCPKISATATPLNASPNEMENVSIISETEKDTGSDGTPNAVNEQNDESLTDQGQYFSVDSSVSILSLLDYSGTFIPGEFPIDDTPNIFPELISIERKNNHHLEFAAEAGFVYYDFRPSKSDAWLVQNIDAGSIIGGRRLSYSMTAAYTFELQHHLDIQVFAFGSVVPKKINYSMTTETYKEIFSDGNQSRYAREEEVQNRVYNESIFLGGIGLGLEKRWNGFSILVGGGIETSAIGRMGSNIKTEIGKEIKFEKTTLKIYTFYRQSFHDKPYSTDEVFITPHQIGLGIKKRI